MTTDTHFHSPSDPINGVAICNICGATLRYSAGAQRWFAESDYATAVVKRTARNGEDR